MDQKSFSVLLNFSQSSPFEGGAISGAVALSAAYAVNENSSRASPTSFLMNRTFRDDAGRGVGNCGGF